MALKQLMLQRKIDNANKLLEELRNNDNEFETRSDQLEESINDAETDEEIETVETEINKLEEEKEAHETEKKKLEDEIEELEEELRELNDKAPKNKPKGAKRNMENTGELRQAINTFIRTKGAVQERDIEGFKVVDGGILVPEELLSAEEKPEDVVDLLKYVREVKVNRGSGKYPVISKSGTRMNTVEELQENPELAKPKIDDVSYDIDTYRGYIPVSQEVIDDADYDIVGLIDEEIKDQGLNTRNFAIANVLKAAPEKNVEGLDGLKTLINTGFKNAYQTKLFVSKSMYNELDLLKDDDGRYLLQDNITLASGKSFKGKEVVTLDDDIIGDKEGDLVGFIGDAKAFCRFFNRKQTYAKWVEHNIYGQLLAAFIRFDVKDVDEDAGYYVTFTPSEDAGGVEG